LVESEPGIGSVFTVRIKQQSAGSGLIGRELAENLENYQDFDTSKSKINVIIREHMPYGKVLLVDDNETNLYVAEGLLSPYGLKITTADSGFLAIEKVESKESYDIIFMDHMMPQMDGIETTQKLREMGYEGIIVALTANALVGNDEMFLQSGSDGFLAKPIDIRQLNEILNKFVRDRYPEEVRRQKVKVMGMTAEQPKKPGLTDKKLMQIFCRGAAKAIVTMRETKASDVKLFTTTAHAMKSALANIGENEISEFAAALEDAGIKGDTEYIMANAEQFFEMLDDLIKSMIPHITETANEPDAGTDEDIGYLIEQLRLLKQACEDYKSKESIQLLEKLIERKWNREIMAKLKEIHDKLYFSSDFEEAAEMSAALLAGVNK
jgi:CheY-like chemotaxis protein